MARQAVAHKVLERINSSNVIISGVKSSLSTAALCSLLRINHVQQDAVTFKIKKEHAAAIGIEGCGEAGNTIDVNFPRDLFSQKLLTTIVSEKDKFGFHGSYHRYRLAENKSRSTLEEIPQNQNVVVEFSSPNIAKPFHAGHVRSTVLGSVLSRLWSRLGHNVTRINFLGDWGTQFGLLCSGFKAYGNEEKLNSDPLSHLLEVYVKVNEEAKLNQTVLQEGLQYFSDMEKGSEDHLDLWRRFRATTIQEFGKLYKCLNVEFDALESESNYSVAAKQLLELLHKSGSLISDEAGRGLVEVKNLPKKMRRVSLAKSDGSTLYLTRDLAAILKRKEKYDFDRIFYVVENGQRQHFQQMLAVLHEHLNCDWANCPVESVHVAFGRYSGMSTRAGTATLLSDVLKEATHQCSLRMRDSQTTRADSTDEVAERLGISSVVVNELRNKRLHSGPYDWQICTSPGADSGPYLQYCHARLHSLEERCGFEISTDVDCSLLDDERSAQLLLQLAKFEESVKEAFLANEPSKITRQLFNIAHATNNALHELRVKDQPKEIAQVRLLLFHCSRLVIASGLRFMGLEPLDKL